MGVAILRKAEKMEAILIIVLLIVIFYFLVPKIAQHIGRALKKIPSGRQREQ